VELGSKHGRGWFSGHGSNARGFTPSKPSSHRRDDDMSGERCCRIEVTWSAFVVKVSTKGASSLSVDKKLDGEGARLSADMEKRVEKIPAATSVVWHSVIFLLDLRKLAIFDESVSGTRGSFLSVTQSIFEKNPHCEHRRRGVNIV
jgi:hypothetical protein